MHSLGFRRTSLLVLLALLMLNTQAGSVSFSAATDVTGRSDLTGVSVKVLVSSGPSYGSAFALHYMFEWMNATAEYISADEVNSTTLSGCDILAAPGGSAFTYSAMLGTEGREAIVNFVSLGGSYFGICGGATLASRYGLELFDGVMRQPVPGVESGTYMIQLTVNRSCFGPDLSDEPENITTLYWESAYLDPDNWTGIHPITTYVGSEYSPMVAFEYGNGSVFLSCPHPEYEEDDERDGTDQFDYLEDPESEWGLLLKVACWLINVSPTAPQEDHSLLVVGMVVTGVMAIVVIRVARNRFSK